MEETICDVYWEGSFEWDKRHLLNNPDHVLYAIFGTHYVYGQNVLLYIGMTQTTIAERLTGHTWLRDESDFVKIKVASVGIYNNIESWWQAWDTMSDNYVYPRPDAELIGSVEALLIYAHQPAYNTMGKASPIVGKRLRIFNTGKHGLRLPEVSHAYFEG